MGDPTAAPLLPASLPRNDSSRLRLTPGGRHTLPYNDRTSATEWGDGRLSPEGAVYGKTGNRFGLAWTLPCFLLWPAGGRAPEGRRAAQEARPNKRRPGRRS